MKAIQIKATPFFEMLKTKDTSMWEIFAQLMDGEEKELIFTDDQDQILFSYTLPDSLEKLNEDREKFAQEYAEKLSGMN
ncbi:hypothetical protein [Chryseobacterium sp. MFBS3-17]|uniref:hypothetical protein n=1 Tax=Chryseobacterium sp. MFBS3-17 TaxID=2886689 RepID=UPI001D0EDD45|nr:hypothetical protein [Chryseobacterium sp. MFBS3-17]MCC2591442.1 hypothetical protein [Chryseobacterium sp. MFBS3-17]